MENVDELRKIVSGDAGLLSSRMTESFISKTKPELVTFVKGMTSFYSDTEINFTKRIMLVLGGFTSRITCSCGKEISPMARGESAGTFRRYCSQVCVGSANKGKKVIRTEEHQKTINEKRATTMLETYGHAYNSQRSEVKLILSASKYVTHNHIRYDLLEDKEFLLESYKTLPSTEIGELCGCDYSVVLDYLRLYGVEIGTDHTKMSQEQRKLGEFVSDLGFDVSMNARVLDGQDIDVFCPNKNVGIEYNGFPHHLESFTKGKRGRDYHANKTVAAKGLGVRLIHIFPHDLYGKPEVVRSILRNALGVAQTKIHARKCTIGVVSKREAARFFERNHLKGNASFQTAIGLFHDGQLVQVTSYGPSRFDKQYQHEVIRSATILNTSVVGGLSRCMKYFIDGFCTAGDKIMTYADRAISEGHSYEKVGFTFVRSTAPGYHYTERNNGGFLVHSRYKFQKHKLTHLPAYSEDKTEWEIMKESGYDRFWDSGNNMYELTVNHPSSPLA